MWPCRSPKNSASFENSRVVRLEAVHYNPPPKPAPAGLAPGLSVVDEFNVVAISLLLPTRKRVPQLERALASIIATARCPDALEVVLYVDEDDAESRAVECSALRLVKLVGRRASMGAITRTCYEASQGRYIMLANDDIVFHTPDWDSKVLSAFGQFVDEVALVWGNDLCSGAPAHPFLSRATCDLMGGVCPAAYYREFIDTHLLDVFRRLERRGHSRAVYLPHVAVEHLHFTVGKAKSDEGYADKRREQDELAYVERREQRAHQAALLANYIEHHSLSAVACGGAGGG